MAVITKLLEGTLAVGQTTISFTDTDIPNSFIRVGSTNDDLFPSNISISGNVLTITYEAQSSALGVIVELVKDDLSVIDSLESESQTDALSANQGYVLKGLIDNITPITELSALDDVSISEPAAGDILTYDSINETWDNIPMPSIPFELDDLSDVTISTPTDGQALVYNNGVWENDDISGTSEIIYSTTERKIGKWHDGSDLYEITVIINAMPSTPYSLTSYQHDILNVKEICVWSGYIKFSSGTVHAMPTVQFSNGAIQTAGCNFAQVTPTTIDVMVGTDRSSAKGLFVIRYTKNS